MTTQQGYPEDLLYSRLISAFGVNIIDKTISIMIP